MNYTLTVDWDTTEALLRSILKDEIATVTKGYSADDEELLKALIKVHNYFSARTEWLEEAK